MLLNCVPHYLGFDHVSRQDVVNKHSSPLAQRLLSGQSDTVVLVVDGTYLYVEVCKIHLFSQ